jgi:hypothetical protein
MRNELAYGKNYKLSLQEFPLSTSFDLLVSEHMTEKSAVSATYVFASVIML